MSDAPENRDRAEATHSGMAAADMAESALALRDSGARLAEVIASQLEEDILEANLAVGSVFGSEAELIERYSLSRAVFREAVRIVEHHEIAKMRRGRGGGLIVTAPDGRSVRTSAALYLRYRKVQHKHLTEMRLALEVAGVAAATEQIDEAGTAELKRVLEEEERMGASAFEVGDPTFKLHVAIAQLSHNPALALFVDVLGRLEWDLLARDEGRRRYWHVDEDQAFADYHYAHQRIVDAIISGDSSLAQQRMRRHLKGIADL